MQNTLHYIALQLAGRVSAALRGGKGSEVELENGAVVGVRVGVFWLWVVGVGPACIQYLVKMLSSGFNCERGR